MAKPVTRGSNPVGQSTQKWDGPKDARTEKGAGDYPNYYTHRTRSGHVITLDDSKDHESITIQHRGGSMMQFMPDGAVQFVSQNGRYSFIFGEDRMEIHGAQEITVHGNATLRVDENMDTTIMGNHNMTVNGDFNVTAKNFNAQVRGDMQFNAKSLKMAMEGSSEISSHGITNIHSDGGVAMTSTSAGIGLAAATDVAIKAKGGKMMMQASDDIHVKTESKLNMQSTGKASLKSAGTVAIEGPSAIHLNTSGAASSADDASLTFAAAENPNAGGNTVEAGSSGSGGTATA